MPVKERAGRVAGPAAERVTPTRTQEQRRAQTQARLLEATVGCLAELGWAGTTTIEVARRAGVSRGAQQHHYPTKTKLVAAAIDHLLDRQRAEYEQAFARLPDGARTADEALDLLWSIFRGPSFAAVLELIVAARTDQALRPLCASINERVVGLTVGTFNRIFPESGAREVIPVALRALLAMFTGMALIRGVDGDPERHCDELLEFVKVLGRPLTSEPRHS
jgi:AcrR family transcriptional regulator